MIVDDSMVARAVLSRMVVADPTFEIVAVAGTAEDAIEALGQISVDIILLDLEMPGAGGLRSIPHILAAANGAKVLIVSSLAEEGAEETVAALAMGAADTLPKPGTGRFNGRFSEILLGKLRALGHADPAADRDRLRHATAASRSVGLTPLRQYPQGPVGLVAIGASTGGIHALGNFFDQFRERIGAPILVTQHLPAPFMPVFARQLSASSGRKAVVAQDNMRLQPDEIHIAPGDAHLAVQEVGGHLTVRLERNRAASGCLPSVDPMFASAGAVLGKAAVGVVLTGMGRDGVEGATRLVACGGGVFAQDEASCAVWGMPKSVTEAGLVCGVFTPGQIARAIVARVEEAACR
jgi:two-component system chemotaxis response regulator CheB